MTAGPSWRLTEAAEADYASILRWTLRSFGRTQFERYRALLDYAMATIAGEPLHPSSRQRDEIAAGIRTFQVGLVASRRRSARHLLVYRIATDDVVEVLRILHESMDVARHLPEDP